jgi:hypothetical protein
LCQKSRDKQMSCDSLYTTTGGVVPAKPHGFRTVSVRFSTFTAPF